MSTEPYIQHMSSDELLRDQRLFMALGIGMVVLGIICVAVPLVATFAIAGVVGVAFLAGGVMSFIHTFRSQRRRESILEYLLSFLYILAGIVLLAYPLGSVLAITMFLAVFFVVEGVFKIVQARRMRHAPRWGWALFSGIVSLFLGVVILAGLPMTALWAVGLVVGIDLLFGGFATTMIAMSMRDALHEGRTFCIGTVCYQ